MISYPGMSTSDSTRRDQAFNRELRTPDSLRRHYEIERTLAKRLMSASASERPGLYSTVYDELFKTVLDHPQNVRKHDPVKQQKKTDYQLELLGRFLTPTSVYLEVGPGDCHLTMAVARKVRRAIAVDVSEILPREVVRPDNFSLILTDGTTIDVEPSSVDITYSNQLMEHLHPDDAEAQLRQIYRAIKPGGKYVCVTPHRFSGPHDISCHFVDVAEGFHLKEYSWGELRQLFNDVGFRSVEMWMGIKHSWVSVPSAAVLASETMLDALPTVTRKRFATRLPFRTLFTNITIVGCK